MCNLLNLEGVDVKITALFLMLILSLTLLTAPLPLSAQQDEPLVETSEEVMDETPVTDPVKPAMKAGDAVKATGVLQDAVTDEDGKVLYYGIWDNTDFCFVIADHGAKDKELAALAGKTVTFEGVYVKDLDGNKLITVNTLTAEKEEEPVSNPPVIEEDATDTTN